MSYTHFTLEERKYLQKLLSEGLSLKKIAAILERSPSFVSREVNRNKAKYKPHKKSNNPYWYNHWRAQNLYITRRRQQRRMALRPETEEWNFIIAGLEQYWSPETIAGRWHFFILNVKRFVHLRFIGISKRRFFRKLNEKHI